MKPGTRDNLIYLSVGIGIAALVAADFFYADSHGTKMWLPSKFAFRAVTTSGLLVYLVTKAIRTEKATPFQIFAAVLFAMLVQLGILFTFRQRVNDLPGLSYVGIAVGTMFIVFLLTLQFVRLIKSER